MVRETAASAVRVVAPIAESVVFLSEANLYSVTEGSERSQFVIKIHNRKKDSRDSTPACSFAELNPDWYQAFGEVRNLEWAYVRWLHRAYCFLRLQIHSIR